MDKVNFVEKLEKFSDLWTPKVIAEMNDYQFKVAIVKGEFVWHNHKETDEVFIVIEGEMFIEFKTETIKLEAGDLIVVPKGTEHRPFANDEASIMLVEPRGIVNTGDKIDKLTAPNDQWI